VKSQLSHGICIRPWLHFFRWNLTKLLPPAFNEIFHWQDKQQRLNWWPYSLIFSGFSRVKGFYCVIQRKFNEKRFFGIANLAKLFAIHFRKLYLGVI